MKKQETEDRCPNCGYCPTCGRANARYPWTYPVPYSPWWTITYPGTGGQTVTYPMTTWTSGTSGGSTSSYPISTTSAVN